MKYRAPASASGVKRPNPISMYPTWLMLWNDKMRRNSFCATAPSTPVTMVQPASTRMSACVNAVSCMNTSVNRRTNAYTPTLVSKPTNTADTATGGVWYDADSQKNNGKTAALMPNPTRNSMDTVRMSPG